MKLASLITLCFIGFDILSGILKGLHNGDINSTKLRQGLLHKASEIITIVGSYLFDTFVVSKVITDLAFNLCIPVCIYICIMEFTSIVENLCDVNPDLSKFFEPYLEKIKGKEDDKNEQCDSK